MDPFKRKELFMASHESCYVLPQRIALLKQTLVLTLGKQNNTRCGNT